MLELTDKTILVGDLSLRLENLGAGALASFEGRVRNHHLGRKVKALEYEAAPLLAQKEFRRIVESTLVNSDILDVLCVHRLGRLEVGETAIWLGVLAPHRAEAFAACEHLMSELKKRLPIWKKEFFEDGTASWVSDPCGCVHI